MDWQTSSLNVVLEQLQWGPLYRPLLQNLEVSCKNPTPAGPLNIPPFCMPLRIPPPTLHSWRPSKSPSKCGPHHFYFLLSVFSSFPPCLSPLFRYSRVEHHNNKAIAAAIGDFAGAAIRPPHTVGGAQLWCRWCAHHTHAARRAPPHRRVLVFRPAEVEQGRRRGRLGIGVELVPAGTGSGGAGSSASTRLAVAARAPGPPRCGGARVDLALARRRRAGVLRPRLRQPRVRQRGTRSKSLAPGEATRSKSPACGRDAAGAEAPPPWPQLQRCRAFAAAEE
jgi:hypothetical protein